MSLELVQPKPGRSPIDGLVSRIWGDLVHMSSPDNVYAIMGAVAANMLKGPPVWLLFIGPPGHGKSELMDSLSDLPKVEYVSSITGEQAYTSATPDKKRSPRATGGLLQKLGSHGLIVSSDITGLLTDHPNKREALMAAERQIYDGKYNRVTGVDGGRDFPWKGKIGRVAGVTDAIDHYNAISSSLGERWVYYRWPKPIHDWYEMAKFVADHAEDEERKPGLARLVAAMFEKVGIGFGEPTKADHPPDSAEISRIIDMSKLACQCRSAVPRDQYSKEILSRRGTIESPNRLAGTFRQLYAGMAEIGVPIDAIWRIVSRCALHSMHPLRLDIVFECWKNPGGVEYGEIMEVHGCSKSTAERAAHDLKHNGVIIMPGASQGVTTLLYLEDSVRRLLDRFFMGVLGTML